MSVIEYGALTVTLTLSVALAGLLKWFSAETRESQKKIRFFQKEVLTLNQQLRESKEKFTDEKTVLLRKLMIAEQEYVDYKASIEERDVKRAVRSGKILQK